MATDFIQTYFLDPIRYNTGYNIVNTTVFAILLIVAVFGTMKLLQKLKIRVDHNLLVGVFPFILLGGILRALQDLTEASGVARNLLLISPGIYVTLFVLTFGALLFSRLVERMSTNKIPYYKTWFTLGIVGVLWCLFQIRLASSFALTMMLGIAIGWGVFLYALRFFVLRKKTPYLQQLLTPENTFLIFVHLFDATTTFVTLQFFPNYFEQHVLPGFLIGIFGPVAMFPLKLLVVPTVLYIFDKELKKPEELEKRTFLKLVVLILGLGPGTRNFLRLVMQV